MRRFIEGAKIRTGTTRVTGRLSRRLRRAPHWRRLAGIALAAIAMGSGAEVARAQQDLRSAATQQFSNLPQTQQQALMQQLGVGEGVLEEGCSGELAALARWASVALRKIRLRLRSCSNSCCSCNFANRHRCSKRPSCLYSELATLCWWISTYPASRLLPRVRVQHRTPAPAPQRRMPAVCLSRPPSWRSCRS